MCKWYCIKCENSSLFIVTTMCHGYWMEYSISPFLKSENSTAEKPKTYDKLDTL